MADSITVAPPRLIDAQEVARRLGCSIRHVWRLRDAGKMPPPVSLGALLRWSSESIDDWIRRGCPSSRKGGR
jgi:predicted DNA-binding transcriptional regulator AlpA